MWKSRIGLRWYSRLYFFPKCLFSCHLIEIRWFYIILHLPEKHYILELLWICNFLLFPIFCIDGKIWEILHNINSHATYTNNNFWLCNHDSMLPPNLIHIGNKTWANHPLQWSAQILTWNVVLYNFCK